MGEEKNKTGERERKIMKNHEEQKLSEFLEKVGGKESDIIEYKGSKALAAVKQDGFALRYVDKSIFTKE